MPSIQRRLNSTGRKRIARDHVRIELTPALDAFSFSSATATINLSGLGLDADATVVLEAYFRSSSMRFSCGTVAVLRPPKSMVLSEVDRGGAIHFRLLVIAADNSGRILASAEGLRPHQKLDSPDRQPLLTVRERDIREQLWKLDLNDRNGPVLLINSKVPGFAARLRAEPLLQGLILPHALREVLRHLPAEGETEDDHDWGDGWRKFLVGLDAPSEPEDPDEEESKEDWIEDVVERFSSLKCFAELVRGEATRHETEHA
jgi:hypothetical protein